MSREVSGITLELIAEVRGTGLNQLLRELIQRGQETLEDRRLAATMSERHRTTLGAAVGEAGKRTVTEGKKDKRPPNDSYGRPHRQGA